MSGAEAADDDGDALRPELRRAIARSWPGARIVRLAGDASTRRFFRVRPVEPRNRDASVVVMDYGAPFAGTTDDVVLTGVLRDADLPVPRIIGIHADPGFLALEDLGDTMLETVLAASTPQEARGWLARAVDLAVAVAVNGTPALERSARVGGPALDRERFRYEMDFFVEHFVEGLLGLGGSHAGLRAALGEWADAAADSPCRVLCHRDFHSRNLMVRGDRTLAMVDVQDARWGPDSYDLASLLFDAYVEIEAETVDALVERYLRALPTDPEGDFHRRFHTVAVQRMVKALGTFGYQMVVRGNRRYGSAIQRTLGRLHCLAPSLTVPFRDVFQNP